MNGRMPRQGDDPQSISVARHHALMRMSLLVWLMPVYFAATFLTTLRHQPDPKSSFGAWSRFVTTDRFLVSHWAGSIGGQVLFVLAATALAVLAFAYGARPGRALVGAMTALAGSCGLLVGFGVAAAAQPSVGRLYLGGEETAVDVYHDMYAPITMTVLISGAVMFAVGTVVLAVACSGPRPVADRFAILLFGASGPLVAVFGVLVSELQTVGSVAGVIGSGVLAWQLRRTLTSGPPMGRSTRHAGGSPWTS